jgi:hypothetical protein
MAKYYSLTPSLENNHITAWGSCQTKNAKNAKKCAGERHGWPAWTPLSGAAGAAMAGGRNRCLSFFFAKTQRRETTWM